MPDFKGTMPDGSHYTVTDCGSDQMGPAHHAMWAYTPEGGVMFHADFGKAPSREQAEALMGVQARIREPQRRQPMPDSTNHESNASGEGK